jgi:hypothetical protein
VNTLSGTSCWTGGGTEATTAARNLAYAMLSQRARLLVVEACFSLLALASATGVPPELALLALGSSGVAFGNASGGAATTLAAPGVWLDAGCTGAVAGAPSVFLALNRSGVGASADATLLRAQLPPDGSSATSLSSGGVPSPLACAGAASLPDGTPALYGLAPSASGKLQLGAVYPSAAGGALRSSALGGSAAACAGPAGAAVVDAARGVLHTLCGAPGAGGDQQLVTLNLSTGTLVRSAALGAAGVYFTALAVDAAGKVQALALGPAATAGAAPRLQTGTLELTSGAGWSAAWTAASSATWVHAGSAASAAAAGTLAWTQSTTPLSSANALYFADSTTPLDVTGISIAVVALPGAPAASQGSGAAQATPPVAAEVATVSLVLSGLTSFDAATARAVAASVAVSLGGGLSADNVTVVITDFLVASSMALGGITLATWTSAAATAFALGVGEDLGVAASRVTLGTATAAVGSGRRQLLHEATPHRRQLLADSLLVPFTVFGACRRVRRAPPTRCADVLSMLLV